MQLPCTGIVKCREIIYVMQEKYPAAFNRDDGPVKRILQWLIPLGKLRVIFKIYPWLKIYHLSGKQVKKILVLLK
jgi:hypothetical protein